MKFSKKMLALKVFLLIIVVVSDSLVRSAPVENRLRDVLIFDSELDSLVEVPDPTKRLNIPNVSHEDAEVVSILKK